MAQPGFEEDATLPLGPAPQPGEAETELLPQISGDLADAPTFEEPNFRRRLRGYTPPAHSQAPPVPAPRQESKRPESSNSRIPHIAVAIGASIIAGAVGLGVAWWRARHR